MGIRVRKSSGRPPGRPSGKHYQEDIDARQLREMIRRQVRFYLREQQALELAWAIKREEEPNAKQLQAAVATLKQMSADDVRRRLEAIDVLLTRITKSAVDTQRVLEQQRETIPDDQLEAQFRAELLRALEQFGDEEWAVIEAARARRRNGVATA